MRQQMQIDPSSLEQRLSFEPAQFGISSRRFDRHSDSSHSVHMCFHVVQEVDLHSDLSEKKSLSLTLDTRVYF